MRTLFLTASLAISAGVAALPHGTSQSDGLAPPLPAEAFRTMKQVYWKLEDILSSLEHPSDGDDLLSRLGKAHKGGFSHGQTVKITEKVTTFLSSVTKITGPGQKAPAQPAEGKTPAKAAASAPQSGESDAQALPALPVDDATSADATCTNPKVRREWDQLDDNDKQAYVDAIKCLQNAAPSGKFPEAKSRWEDLVALHRQLTPNVHGNAKLLPWHRFYLHLYEHMLNTECGYEQAIPWIDMTKDNWITSSSFFTSQWFGSYNSGANCVTDGQFANMAINVGPGAKNEYHCLQRVNSEQEFGWLVTSSDVSTEFCQEGSDFAGFSQCHELALHAWGHQGIGGVMADLMCSSADAAFYGLHGVLDREWRLWQNKDGNRVRNIDGNDVNGKPLTLDTPVSVMDMIPSVTIGDIIDTMGPYLCYKYSY